MPARRHPSSARADGLRSVDATARQAGRQARRRRDDIHIHAAVDPMCAERILVALGMLRQATAVSVCKALGVDASGDDYVTVCQRLSNMHALGSVDRYRLPHERDRVYRLTETGCELAMLVQVQPSGEAPVETSA